MLVRKVLVEYPTDQTPPSQLVITFPSLKKRRRATDVFASLKDRLPLTFIRQGEVEADTAVLAGIPPDPPGKRVVSAGSQLEAQQNEISPTASTAPLLLKDPQENQDSLDKQLERQLLRSADDDLFDQVVLPLLSVQLKVRGLSRSKDALVLTACDCERQDDRSGETGGKRQKRPAPRLQEKRIYQGPVKIWEFSLATEVGKTIDNDWFRRTRQIAMAELGRGGAIVVDAPTIGWWEVMPDAYVLLPGKRNTQIPASEGIAPSLEDGMYYDEYKDLETQEFSDADSVDYGLSDSDRDEFKEYFDDSSDANEDDQASLDSSTNGFEEYLR